MPDDINLNLRDAFSGVTDWIDSKKQQTKSAQDATKMKFETDHMAGISTFKGPTDLVIEKVKKASEFDRIQGIYNQRLAEVQARESYMQKHPWQNALAELAASMAANDRNPVTRGIGQAAQRLNPTRQELGQEELSLTQALSSIGSQEETRKFRVQEFEEREKDRATALAEKSREFDVREAETAARNMATEEYRSQSEKDRAATANETARHHKELESEANARLREAEAHIAEAKNKGKELDIAKITNALTSGGRLVEGYDAKITDAKQRLNQRREALDKLLVSIGPSPTMKQSAIGAQRSFEADQKIMLEQIKKLEETRDKTQRRLDAVEEKVLASGSGGQKDSLGLFK